MADFKYSLNGSTIRTTGVMRQIEVAAAAGYVGIELWFDKIDEYTAAGGTVAEIKQALDAHGLAVPTTLYLCDWFVRAKHCAGWLFGWLVNVKATTAGVS